MKYLILLSVLFFVSEFALMLVKRSKKIKSKQQGDKGSLVLLWVTITLCLTVGFSFANYNIWTIANYTIAAIGALMIIFGAIIRWIAIVQLSSAFTVDVAISNNHKLKTDGIYKYIRHPSYSGLLLIMTGFAICMNSVISLLVIIPPMFVILLYRIYVEEQLLAVEFGDVYTEYKTSTSRIIPWIL
ncbi:MAG: isoprenylcysteine carboxylmethyltransferase family protein [Bacteroidales bacterium]|nr:isoprenylcysteine carboxylmethyltransferase family protein [Bacteroidales bacterium]